MSINLFVFSRLYFLSHPLFSSISFFCFQVLVLFSPYSLCVIGHSSAGETSASAAKGAAKLSFHQHHCFRQPETQNHMSQEVTLHFSTLNGWHSYCKTAHQESQQMKLINQQTYKLAPVWTPTMGRQSNLGLKHWYQNSLAAGDGLECDRRC